MSFYTTNKAMAEPTRIDVAEKRYGCYKWGLLVALFISVITIITVILLLFNKNESRVVIAFCLILFVIIGLGSIIFIEFKRRKAAIRREQSAHEWVRKTLQDQRRPFEANGTPDQSRTSWSKWKPWKMGGSSGASSSSPLRYETMTGSSTNSATA